MSERYNAFISYAWRDNEPFDEGGKGWVSTFVDRLGKHLKRELPRAVAKDRIWLDYEQMRGNHNIADNIRRELEASRLLVPIISRGYLESTWCAQELETFIACHGAGSGRIFPVMMEPLKDLRPELGDLLKYPFWYEDDRKQPRTRWFPDIDPTDREYGFTQQNMARDMAAAIEKTMADGAAEKAAAPATKPTAAEAAPPAIELAGNHIVLVNGGEEDAELILKAAECLGKTYGVGAMTPISVLPDQEKLKSSEITRDLRDKLKLCTAVFIVYRKGPGHQINRHITEYLKTTPQRPKGMPPASLDICHPADEPAAIGFQLPQMRAHPCDTGCTDDCIRSFIEALASS